LDNIKKKWTLNIYFCWKIFFLSTQSLVIFTTLLSFRWRASQKENKEIRVATNIHISLYNVLIPLYICTLALDWLALVLISKLLEGVRGYNLGVYRLRWVATTKWNCLRRGKSKQSKKILRKYVNTKLCLTLISCCDKR